MVKKEGGKRKAACFIFRIILGAPLERVNVKITAVEARRVITWCVGKVKVGIGMVYLFLAIPVKCQISNKYP